MKHVRLVTVVRADAFSDFLNSLFRAWSDYVFAKKNGAA